MKDVISVDSIVSYVADSSITLGNRHPRVLKEAKQRLHSLLISKLPEKSEVKYKKWIDGKIVDKKSPVVCPRCLWLSKSYRHCENCGKHINTKEVE